MISVNEIVERIQNADIYGLLDVRGSDSGDYAILDFWRLTGAFRNNKESCIRMVVDPAKEGLENELWFYVPPLEDCGPRDLALTAYMDANARCYHGGHAWVVGEKGDIFFRYAMPVPEGQTEFPDAPLLERLLKDMYGSLLFRELKNLELQIVNDDMLSDEEKKEKFEKALEMHKRLIGSRVEDDGTV